MSNSHNLQLFQLRLSLVALCECSLFSILLYEALESPVYSYADNAGWAERSRPEFYGKSAYQRKALCWTICRCYRWPASRTERASCQRRRFWCVFKPTYRGGARANGCRWSFASAPSGDKTIFVSPDLSSWPSYYTEMECRIAWKSSCCEKRVQAYWDYSAAWHLTFRVLRVKVFFQPTIEGAADSKGPSPSCQSVLNLISFRVAVFSTT